MEPQDSFEEAVFTDAQRRSYRNRLIVLAGLLLLLAAGYWIVRDLVYARFTRRFSQQVLNNLINGKVEKIGSILLNRQGDFVVRNVEVSVDHKGVDRTFYRAHEIRVAVDGIPFHDDNLRVMRVDLHRPEIFLRREPGGDWNLAWALRRREPPPLPAPAPAPAPQPEPQPPPPPPRDTYPPNGVHIHDGTLHLTIITKSGKESMWTFTGVRGSIRREGEGRLVARPCSGDFYGGRVEGWAEIARTSPLTIDQLMVDIRGADVARMAEGTHFIKRPVSGRLDAVVTATVDPERTRKRPIASGRCQIRDGNLWEFPALSGILSLLSLTSVTERRIDSARLDFTFEEDQIRIDVMHLLGYPVSLFGDGACGLAGEWIRVIFVPRLGKSDVNSILPLIGAPVDLLLDVLKGSLVPVVLTGSFEKPEFSVDPLHFLKPVVKERIEEKSPR